MPHLRTRVLRTALALVVLIGPSGLAAQAIPSIPFERVVLDNGLEVLLHQDRSTPVVAVNVYYKVGAGDEKRGRTGFAHLFEHIMFMGSANVPVGKFDQWLEAAGGNNNGTTNQDRTNYYEWMPSNALPLALWLEADRMGNLLPTLDQAKLDLQRDVVKNERRQSYDNQPYGRAYETLLAALYPATTPPTTPFSPSRATSTATARWRWCARCSPAFRADRPCRPGPILPRSWPRATPSWCWRTACSCRVSMPPGTA